MQKNKTYFFKASGIILSNFGKIHFFPLKKFKKDLEYFQKIGPQRGPDPPHKGKNFSLHFWTNWTILHTFKKMQKIDFPPLLMQNFRHFFYFSYFVSLPNGPNSFSHLEPYKLACLVFYSFTGESHVNLGELKSRQKV